MKQFKHGMILGKFYPPHLGHHQLIRDAAAQCDRLTVLMLGASVESISINDRVKWLKLEHASEHNVEIVGAVDDFPIDFHDHAVWKQHVDLAAAVIARSTIMHGHPGSMATIDAVFSSEKYGDELARRFGAQHLYVERDARSGTRARADLIGHWDDLAAPTKAGLAMRVVFTGAESTGTTTTSLATSAALRARGGAWNETQWVPEFGRDYTIELMTAAQAQAARTGGPKPTMDDLLWLPEDFVDIARRQQDMENEAAANGGPVLVCDTDAFTTGIWEERYLGSRSAKVDEIGAEVAHPLYLVTSHVDVPFEQDGIRDGEHLREWMTSRITERLEETGRNWRLLDGSIAERTEQALAYIDEQCAKSFTFALPLTEGVQE